MKKVTLFRDGNNFGAKFYDGNEMTTWNDLTGDEQYDLVQAMLQMGEFFQRFIRP